MPVRIYLSSPSTGVREDDAQASERASQCVYRVTMTNPERLFLYFDDGESRNREPLETTESMNTVCRASRSVDDSPFVVTGLARASSRAAHSQREKNGTVSGRYREISYGYRAAIRWLLRRWSVDHTPNTDQ